MSEFLEKVKKTREYLDYIEEHYNNVQKAWEEVQSKCKDILFAVDRFGMLDFAVEGHDLSKLDKEEFVHYREHFYPTEYETTQKTFIKDKPYYVPLQIDYFGDAWEHHKKVNTHHWENWTTDNSLSEEIKVLCCIHMVCDWMAMSYKFGGTAKAYYEKNKDKIDLPEWADILVNKIFDRVYK